MERTDGHTLRDGFDRLAVGDTSGVPADLEPGLLNEALVGYADSAPLPVAEHLEPYVAAVTAGAEPDPAEGLELLASAPAAGPADAAAGDEEAGPDDATPTPVDDPGPAPTESLDLDFGAGTTEVSLDEVAEGLAGTGSAADSGGEALDEEPAKYDDAAEPPLEDGGWLDVDLLSAAKDDHEDDRPDDSHLSDT